MSKSWQHQSNWRTWGDTAKVFEHAAPMRDCSCGWGRAGFRGMCECERNEQLPEVVPEEGYSVHSKDGILRCGPRDVDRLVRLGDVVRWLVRAKEIPVLNAVQEVLSCFDGDGVRHVFVVSDESYARSVGYGAGYAGFFTSDSKAQEIPLPLRIASSHAFALYRAWICNMEALGRTVVDADCSEVPSFAVRISRANELWGWGHVPAGVALPDSVASTQAAPAIEVLDVTDWPSQVLRHKNLFESPAAWPESLRRIALEFNESVPGAARGPTTKKQMAEALGVSRDTVDTLLNAALEERVAESARKWMPPAMANGK